MQTAALERMAQLECDVGAAAMSELCRVESSPSPCAVGMKNWLKEFVRHEHSPRPDAVCAADAIAVVVRSAQRSN